MSDQALVWKFAFGALLLLASAVAFVMRNDAPPKAAAPAGAVGPPIELAPAPLPAASEAPAARETAPPDAPDVQEAPTRVSISLHEPRPEIAKAHRPVRRMPAAKLRFVRATHEQARRAHRASPYVAGRPHYPFDPRDRWHSREG
jgi:hypothetical protein